MSVTDHNHEPPTDLVQGTLDALILQALALEPLHGLAVAQRLRARSNDVLNVSRGSLYPALHKLEHEGLLRAEWRLSESGKRAKYLPGDARRPETAGARTAGVEAAVSGHLDGAQADVRPA